MFNQISGKKLKNFDDSLVQTKWKGKAVTIANAMLKSIFINANKYSNPNIFPPLFLTY